MTAPLHISRRHILLLVVLLGTSALVWSIRSQPPAPIASPPETPLAYLENVQNSLNLPGGAIVTMQADKVELKRDFSNLISFAGQYTIDVDGLTLHYDIPELDHPSLMALCRGMNRHLKIYPQSWAAIGPAVYSNAAITLTHQGRTIFHVAAAKAKASPNGGILLTGLSDASDRRLAHMDNISTGLPFFAHLIHSNLKP